eukprot:m.285371 g.285371  ORF g.285371 m.285371 type:complete len:58 (+) comp17774_c0_seq3:1229-1402(+)
MVGAEASTTNILSEECAQRLSVLSDSYSVHALKMYEDDSYTSPIDCRGDFRAKCFSE